jgi:hypothetical protein
MLASFMQLSLSYVLPCYLFRGPCEHVFLAEYKKISASKEQTQTEPAKNETSFSRFRQPAGLTHYNLYS